MLISLELTFFKKHENLKIEFTEGLNVIRAANEAGKSSMLEGLAYAWWGSRALPMSLEETVTWGKLGSALRVKCEFMVSGARYTVTRSKSGAELVGPGVTVSGHAEVTKFISTLLGADLAVGTSVLFSAQGMLKESLDSGAVMLIEKLSNMGLIDSALTKMQEVLPSGNTKMLESQLAMFEQGAEPVANFEAQEQALAKAQGDFLEVTQAEVAMAEKISAMQPKAKDAEKLVADQKRIVTQKTSLLHVLNSINLTKPKPPNNPKTIDELREAWEAQKNHNKLSAAYNTFKAIPTYISSDRGEHNAAFSALEKLIKEGNDVTKLKVQIAKLSTLKITETACGLCGKDLQEVPEVVAKNAKLDAEISEAESALTLATAQAENCSKAMAELVGIRQLDSRISNVAASLGSYVEVNSSVIPPIISWVGDIPGQPDYTNYSLIIKDQQAVLDRYTSEYAKFEAAEKQHATVTAQLAANGEEVDTTAAERTIKEFLDLSKELQLTRNVKQTEAYAVQYAEANLAQAQEMHKQALDFYRKQLSQKAELETTLKATLTNNALIKKLREVRPVVARELWNNVLHGVSTIFSGIRGVPSIVSRSDTGFLIDKKPSAAYSGSTKDSLGVAIRGMLQKTFLHKVDMIVFDEPAAAADDTREEAMLAAITRLDFKQVILVTHSDLADAHAANIITL